MQKKITLLGFKKNIGRYYRKANLFINASYFEGFPNAVVEAISYDIPVICSNSRGGIKEIILNGRGGDMFLVNDALTLSRRIELFYNKLYNLHKKILARKKIIKYSLSNHILKYEKIFSSI